MKISIISFTLMAVIIFASVVLLRQKNAMELDKAKEEIRHCAIDLKSFEKLAGVNSGATKVDKSSCLGKIGFTGIWTGGNCVVIMQDPILLSGSFQMWHCETGNLPLGDNDFMDLGVVIDSWILYRKWL